MLIFLQGYYPPYGYQPNMVPGYGPPAGNPAAPSPTPADFEQYYQQRKAEEERQRAGSSGSDLARAGSPLVRRMTCCPVPL
jgi:hypothetical protein